LQGGYWKNIADKHVFRPVSIDFFKVQLAPGDAGIGGQQIPDQSTRSNKNSPPRQFMRQLQLVFKEFL